MWQRSIVREGGEDTVQRAINEGVGPVQGQQQAGGSRFANEGMSAATP